MGWATRHIAELRAGKTVQFRPRGNSMSGRIEDRQLVTVEPVTDHMQVHPDDVVLCRVRGAEYLHLVIAKRYRRDERGDSVAFQIGNNRGGINGWTPADKVYGRVVRVDP